MSEKIRVLNRGVSPVVANVSGVHIGPGRALDVDALDPVAAAGIASGTLTLAETPEADAAPPKAARTTKTKAAKATAKNEE